MHVWQIQASSRFISHTYVHRLMNSKNASLHPCLCWCMGNFTFWSCLYNDIEAHCYAHQCRQIDVCNYVAVSDNNWLQDVSATSAAYKISCRNVLQSVVDWYCYVSVHNQFAYAYIILVTKRKGNLPLYKQTNCWQPLCCKAFSGNATHRQQHWAYSSQKLSSNH